MSVALPLDRPEKAQKAIEINSFLWINQKFISKVFRAKHRLCWQPDLETVL